MANARFEMRPLGLWDRPTTDPRNPRRFRVPWDRTVDELLAEVDLLDGDRVAIQVDADPTDIRRDGMLRARARVGHPGIKVSFTSRHGPLTYATDAYETWQDNVRAVSLALTALRAVDRYGVTGAGEQYRGWTAIAAQPAEKGLTVDEAVRLLSPHWPGPSADLRQSEAALSAAFRAAAREHHPDAGGTADAFRLISTARDVLLAAIRAGTR